MQALHMKVVATKKAGGGGGGRRKRRRGRREKKGVLLLLYFVSVALLCFACLLSFFLSFLGYLCVHVCVCVCVFPLLFCSFFGVVFLFFLVWLVLCERRNCFFALEGLGKVCCFSLGNSTFF